MPTEDEVFLMRFDKELIKAIDCLDTLLFLRVEAKETVCEEHVFSEE